MHEKMRKVDLENLLGRLQQKFDEIGYNTENCTDNIFI